MNNTIQDQQVKAIVKVLDPNNIQNTCPALLVGKAALLFKQMYKGIVVELKNTAEVRDFISSYMGIESSRPVVISDIGYLPKQASFLLLKLVEESKFPVILLSVEDKVNSILLSRVKKVVKFPVNEKSDNSLCGLKEAYEQVYGEEKKTINEIQFAAENCPQLYQLTSEVPYNKYRNKVISVLGGYYDSN